MIPKMTFDVTQNQIDELKKLKDVHGQNMLSNVRNVQNSSWYDKIKSYVHEWINILISSLQWGQRYTYRVLQTIQIKCILLCVLGRAGRIRQS